MHHAEESQDGSHYPYAKDWHSTVIRGLPNLRSYLIGPRIRQTAIQEETRDAERIDAQIAQKATLIRLEHSRENAYTSRLPERYKLDHLHPVYRPSNLFLC